jgi:hypothetical protein
MPDIRVLTLDVIYLHARPPVIGPSPASQHVADANISAYNGVFDDVTGHYSSTLVDHAIQHY